MTRRYAVVYVLVVLLTGAALYGQVYMPAPMAKMQFLDSSGDPLASGKLYTYITGTSTDLATFTDSTGATTNANPVVLDSAGRADIWLSSSSVYRFRLDNSADVTQYTIDGVRSLPAPIGATSFTSNGVLYGNGTGIIQVTGQGAANTVLTANAGAPAFSSTPPLTSVRLQAISFADLTALTTPNGEVRYCDNCTDGASPCSSGGTGAFAKLLNSIWQCD